MFGIKYIAIIIIITKGFLSMKIKLCWALILLTITIVFILSIFGIDPNIERITLIIVAILMGELIINNNEYTLDFKSKSIIERIKNKWQESYLDLQGEIIRCTLILSMCLVVILGYMAVSLLAKSAVESGIGKLESINQELDTIIFSRLDDYDRIKMNGAQVSTIIYEYEKYNLGLDIVVNNTSGKDLNTSSIYSCTIVKDEYGKPTGILFTQLEKDEEYTIETWD